MQPMNTLSPLPALPVGEEAFVEFTTPLNIVVLFADTVLARRLARIYNDVIEQFAPDCVFNASWWNFDGLHHPEIFSAATRATKEADIVIVAAHAGEDLPDVVKNWIDMAFWKRAGQERLLIGLLALATASQPVDSVANRYLQAAAREAGMEYLLHWSALPVPSVEGSLEDITSRATTVTPLLAEILSHTGAIPHGGIND